jgi:pyruvate/2-oxoglutarate dehydrogenase complex dihydrolipoamide dehydrogenase (E3) component
MTGDRDSTTFDVVVVGAGPAGEVVASRLGERGVHVALVERELVGGECAYWACIPSKTLLRPPEVRSEAKRAAGTSAPEQRWRDIAAYRDYMIRDLDDSNEVEDYEKQGTRVFKGAGRLRAPGELEVGDRILRSERIVLATGSEPSIPAVPGLQESGYWTNREATNIKEVPESAIVLGGGPVGVELAQMLRRFGAEVHLIEPRDRLLAREEQRVSELVADALGEDGIDVRVGIEAESVSTRDGRRVVGIAGGAVEGEVLIVAAGRAPRVKELALERVGLEPTDRGIEIDERCRAGEGIWAVGDVTGVMPFTHVAKYQAQIAVADIAGETTRADYTAVPRVVFSDPEVAAVGMTEEQAREGGIDAVSARIVLGEKIARPSTYETEPRGELAVVADRRRQVLVGAWAVAPLASEWIHYAGLAIKAQIPLAVLRDTIPQFPTYMEGYVKVLAQLEA